MKTPKIKNMKPHDRRYKNGQYRPDMFRKIFEGCRNQPVIYRSSLEDNFIRFCEAEPGILHWASEAFEIQYTSSLDNKLHNYYPDFIIENYRHEFILIEIKPMAQTRKPTANDNVWAKEQWIKNNDKWTAARAWAREHNMKFKIITEEFFAGK